MKSKSKQAKFFCESCGEEVSANAKFCNKCGKFFSSVRCPNCGRTGTTSEFENGCPDCGYAVNKSGYAGYSKKGSGKKNKKGIDILFSKGYSGSSESKSSGSSDSLPFWVYIIAIGVLVIVVACVYSCL